ncbi:peptide ABC transporter substrate-binding protein [Aliidongia dinghuensis]|uniref:Peptide ABC transporter substrate-binding protein n=1 Tax=Aliidongia dinghuensis TaxID=1867774 RepID=A0A8J2Z166_9PROT|nr:ABC transporter substrate-binding protein [Aliidongia dinghuensis]GGF43011.1 peptide ABC transporter substrate-binding protein [Aliidongia dinghuensis]
MTAAAATPLLGRPAFAAPKRGGFMRIGTNDGSQTDTLDPTTWPGTFTGGAFGGSMCNNLTEILPDRSVAGDVAESFESSDQSKRWVFKLRKGLTFHDGRSVASKDVIASMMHHASPNAKSPAKAIFALLDNIKADDNSTVVFNLTGSSPDFPYMLSDYHLPIMPAKEDGTLDVSNPVGTGPFVLEHWEPGSPAKFKRNPNYHKDNKPYFDEVEFVPIPDVVARTNALLTGEVQFINNCDIKTLAMLRRNRDIRISSTPSTRHFSFDMNTQAAPFDNPHVRLALKYAIDRDEIREKVFFGNAEIGNDNNVAQTLKFWAATPPQYEYDVDKARDHLKQAGLASVSVDLSVSDAAFPGAVAAAQLFKEQAARAGITINVVREPDDGYWSKVWRQKSFTGVDWYGRPTVDWLFSTTLAKDAAWNDTKFNNDRFNQLLVQARSETEAHRADIYREMQQILHDEGGMLVVAFANYIDGVSAKVASGTVGGVYPLDNFKLSERWWMA